MITQAEFESARRHAADILSKAGLAIRQAELDRMEVADFGLSELAQSGAQIITLVDTARIAAKILVLLPHQTEPEHRHPPLGDYPGKEETIRCEWGELYLYGPGAATPRPLGRPPEGRRHTYTVWHEYVLHPGGQVTFAPDTPHWFQAGPQGVVMWSFSTKAIDVQDIFTDPDIRRETVIGD
jgi:D-lyxose ketol-isomerase